MRDKFGKPQSNKERKKKRLQSLKEASGVKNAKSIKQLQHVDTYPVISYKMFTKFLYKLFKRN